MTTKALTNKLRRAIAKKKMEIPMLNFQVLTVDKMPKKKKRLNNCYYIVRNPEVTKHTEVDTPTCTP